MAVVSSSRGFHRRPLHEVTPEERFNGASERVKELMRKMKPGDKLVVTRWPDEPGKSSYTAQLRQF